MKQVYIAALLPVTIAFLASCAGSGSGGGGASNPPCQGSSCPQDATPTPPPGTTPTPPPGTTPTPTPIPGSEEIKKLDLKGFVKGGIYDDEQITDANADLGTFSVRVPVATGLSETSGGITQIPGASWSVKVVSSSKSYVTVTVPFKQMFYGASIGAADGLPNGDALPKMGLDQLPHASVPTGNTAFQIDIYMTDSRLAVLVSTPGFNPAVNLEYPVRNRTENDLLGIVSSIAKDGTVPGGFFSGIVIPEPKAKVIREAVK